LGSHSSSVLQLQPQGVAHDGRAASGRRAAGCGSVYEYVQGAPSKRNCASVLERRHHSRPAAAGADANNCSGCIGAGSSNKGVAAKADGSMQQRGCKSWAGVGPREIRGSKYCEQVGEAGRGGRVGRRLHDQGGDHGYAHSRQVTQAHFAAVLQQFDESRLIGSCKTTPKTRHEVCRWHHASRAAGRRASGSSALSKHSVMTLLAHEQPRHVLLRIAVLCSGCLKQAHIMARTISSSGMPSDRACSMAESWGSRVRRRLQWAWA